jgi:hypothetical protein
MTFTSFDVEAYDPGWVLGKVMSVLDITGTQVAGTSRFSEIAFMVFVVAKNAIGLRIEKTTSAIRAETTMNASIDFIRLLSVFMFLILFISHRQHESITFTVWE